MRLEILKRVKEIYFDRNYDLFINKVKSQPNYNSEFQKVLENHEIEIRHYSLQNSPEDEWYLIYKPFLSNDNSINYKSIVRISKIMPLFNISHEFSLNHNNPNKIEPKLDGSGDSPYTFEQAELDNLITDYFIEKNFIKLLYSDMEEVIPNLPMPKEVTIFGSQMTVDNALFHDLYNITEGINGSDKNEDNEDTSILISKSELEELRAYKIEQEKLDPEDIEAFKKWKKQRDERRQLDENTFGF